MFFSDPMLDLVATLFCGPIAIAFMVICWHLGSKSLRAFK
jgi:hypothetical protein